MRGGSSIGRALHPVHTRRCWSASPAATSSRRTSARSRPGSTTGNRGGSSSRPSGIAQSVTGRSASCARMVLQPGPTRHRAPRWDAAPSSSPIDLRGTRSARRFWPRLHLPGLMPFLYVPLAEPQVPADPVTPKPPLPPASVDRLLRHAQVGSQLVHRQEPVRAAQRSRPGGPVPRRCTLASRGAVKAARQRFAAFHSPTDASGGKPAASETGREKIQAGRGRCPARAVPQVGITQTESHGIAGSIPLPPLPLTLQKSGF